MNRNVGNADPKMPLPNSDRALVEERKLSDYCLCPTHTRGRHKATVFLSALGMTARDSAYLRHALLESAKTAECILKGDDDFGSRYETRFEITFNRRQAIICAGWIVRKNEDFARLTSCYVVI